MTVSLTFLQTPAQKMLMIGYFGSVAHEPTWEQDVGQMAASLKPIASNKNQAHSFPQPFSERKALSLLFAEPDQQGNVFWQPDQNVLSSVNSSLRNAKALTSGLGFKIYDYDETIRQAMFIFKTQLDSEGHFIGAALFNCENGTCNLLWGNPFLVRFGSEYDNLKPEFVSIGQGQHGAVIKAGDTHQGITVTKAILLAVYKDEIVVAARDLPVYEDNYGATEDKTQQYRFTAGIEFLPTDHSAYDNLRLKFSGTTLEESERGGKSISRIIKADFTRNWFWVDEGHYEEEIECGN